MIMVAFSRKTHDSMFVVKPIRRVAADLPTADPLRGHLKKFPADEAIAEQFFDKDLWRVLHVDDNQVDGDWFGPGQEPPSAEPTWYPTGALLPRIGERFKDGAVVLSLVAIDYVWFPLSVAGQHTYASSTGIARKEPWHFVPRHHGREFRWPTVFLAEFVGGISPSDVKTQFGAGAAFRARRDRNTLLYRVRQG